VRPTRGAEGRNLGRRQFLQASAGLILPHFVPRDTSLVRAQPQATLTASDDAFLEDLSHRIFRYFWEQASPETGLVLDRSRTDGSPINPRERTVASIAATGFGLTALSIGAEREWVSLQEARERVRATLRFFANHAPRQQGWFYHWLDPANGERRWQSEVSSLDTALLLGGVLTARQKFGDDPEIVRLATIIYEAVDFPWMLNGDPLLLSHGWKPETGFLRSRWDSFCEHTILYLLAVGSPTHPIPPTAWYAWKRPQITYAGFTYINCCSLFVHQYAHAWIDFRRRRDRRLADFFLNSVEATRAHRAFCESLSREFPGYSADVWGITASDSVHGYVEWGGPPHDPRIDGTVVPCAAGGSLMFTPDICLAALRVMQERFGDQVYGRYGFTDAFRPNGGPKLAWIDSDVIGINLGITLLSIENLRSENVWRWFMSNPEPRLALEQVGFESYP